MFSGATPRDALPSPREVGMQHRGSVPCPKNTLSGDLERIFRNKLGGRVLYEALMVGVEGAALGSDRVHACEARQRDAEAVLARFEDVVKTVGEDSAVILEEDVDARVRGGREEATLNWVLASIDIFQKAIASLEAHELLSRRACRNYDTRHSARLAAYESGNAQSSTPRLSPRMCSGGISRDGGKPPTSFLELHLQAAGVKTKAEERLQEFIGPRRPLESWRSWFFSSVCAACTTRQGEADHSASVVDIVNSMQLRALQAEKGDILCCTPIHVDLDGVRYRERPDADGRVLPMAVKRGEKVPVKGRDGDCIWNSKGYLPLRHPVDQSVLFLFDHKRPEAADDDSEDSSEEESPTKTLTPRSQRFRRPNTVKLLKPNLQEPILQGAPTVEQQQNGSLKIPGGAPPPLEVQNGTSQTPSEQGQQEPPQEARSVTSSAPKVTYSEADRKAAEEKLQQRKAERAAKKAAEGGPSGGVAPQDSSTCIKGNSTGT